MSGFPIVGRKDSILRLGEAWTEIAGAAGGTGMYDRLPQSAFIGLRFHVPTGGGSKTILGLCNALAYVLWPPTRY